MASTKTYRFLEWCLHRLHIPKQYERPEQKFLAKIAHDNIKADTAATKLRHLVHVEKQTRGDMPVYIFSPKQEPPVCRILFLHGGGGMMRPLSFHFNLVKRLVRQGKAEVWMPFYPLAPTYNTVEAIDAVHPIWEEMSAKDLPSFCIGDSAGANMELTLCEQLISEGNTLPDGMIVISPPTGMDKNDGKMQEMEPLDPMLSVRMIDLIAKYWGRGLERTDHRFNSGFVDYTGFPPLLLFYGTHELFYPYIGSLLSRIEESGTPHTYIKGDGLCHDWAVAYCFPEAKKAFQNMLSFLKNPTASTTQS